MEQNLLELTARALRKLLLEQPWEGGGRNEDSDIARFLHYMQDFRSSTAPLRAEIAQITPTQDQDCEMQLAKLKADLQVALKERDAAVASRETLVSEKARLERELDASRQRADKAEREAQAANRSLAETAAQLASARRQVDSLQEMNDLAQKQRLSEQTELYGLQSFLAALTPECRKIMAGYFNLDSLTVFLVQCGQFQRLNQFWEACGKAVAQGASPAPFDAVLRQIFELYNSAAGGNPATLLEPEPGSPYKSDSQLRIDSDGSQVERVLLPGLKNPGGKLMQHALVRLRYK